MSNIYALLVGINHYPQKPLAGCINDVNAFKDYLTAGYGLHPSRQEQHLFIMTLTDADPGQPTRRNLIDAFCFFDDVKDGDSCLFYYSGHGSFSMAPAEFQTDNGYAQSFVCLDSRLPGGRDLMDK
jgi:hypothetical protein